MLGNALSACSNKSYNTVSMDHGSSFFQVQCVNSTITQREINMKKLKKNWPCILSMYKTCTKMQGDCS